ncbi:MAG: hypothetical protein ACI4SG_01265 [Oligosphaeraceae bacterium]
MSSPYTRSFAIAVTWSTASCHAVRLSAEGHGARVAQCWRGELGKDGASPAELVLRGVREVGADEQCYLVAGGNGQGWGMTDLEMPPLKKEELRNALGFELRKQTPLSPEKLRWGYRVLPRTPGKTTRRIRLYYVRTENWNSWLKSMEGLHHADALLPAPVALDPLLAGKNFILPGEDAAAPRYTYQDSPSGRVVQPLPEDASPSLEEILPASLCQTHALEKYPAEERPAFTAAILLALYGMTESLGNDHATLVPLPERFQARRHVGLKALAACLCVVLLALFAYVASGNLSGHARQLRQLDEAIRKTTAELEALQKQNDPKDTERTSLLQQELLDNIPAGPDFPTALLAITQIIPETHWTADAFEWRNGKIGFRIQGPSKLEGLPGKLEDSPYLGDVTERLSAATGNLYSQRFELTARYDTPLEAQVRKNREEERLQKEQEQRRRQEAAAREASEEGAEEDWESLEEEE